MEEDTIMADLSEMTATTDIPYNPFLRDFYVDPRPVYRRLRDEAPVYWAKDCNLWVLSRYDDVRAGLLNWKVFSNEAGSGSNGEVGEVFQQAPNLLMFDPPRHTHLRKIIARLITPQRMMGLKDYIRTRVNELLDPLEGEAEFDLTQDFADPLPTRVIADLLGIPQEDAPMLMKAVDKLADHGPGNVEKRTAEALTELCDYYSAYFRERAKRPAGDDIVWHLMEASRSGLLSDAETLGFAILVTIAGGETTTKMIGNMALALFDHPDQKALLAEAPDLTRNAIEESLRYNSSTHMLTRTLTEDFTLHGQTMRAGDSVAMIFNSANNDERKFADPDQYDIRRVIRGDHLAFGAGVHACLGAPLARLELTVAFEEIMRRWPNFQLDKERMVRYFNPFTSGFRHMPFRPR